MDAIYRDARNSIIIDFAKEGYSNSEISDLLGISDGIISSVCRKNGIYGRRADPQKTREKTYKTKQLNGTLYKCKSAEEAKKYIESKTDLYEYVSGYAGVDSRPLLRCKNCGTVKDYYIGNLRHGHIEECPVCKSRRKAAEKEIKSLFSRVDKIRRDTEKTDAKLLSVSNAEEESFKKWKEHETSHTCPVCGKCFTAHKSSVYCSLTCRQKIYDSKRKDRRLRKLKTAKTKDIIILSRLVDISNGICAICGKPVDYNDYHKRDDGVFIAHGNYPSIDHIIPLCDGGLDSWDNVQLAHRSCNSNRYWKEKANE